VLCKGPVRYARRKSKTFAQAKHPRALPAAPANMAPVVDGGLGTDSLTLSNVVTPGGARFTQWESIALTDGSQMTLDSNLVLGDTDTLTGSLSIDATGTLFAGGGLNPVIQPFAAGQLATVTNAGLIDLTNGASGPIDNDIGQGGRLALNTFLGNDAAPSDRLDPTATVCRKPSPDPDIREEVSLYAATPALALLYGRTSPDTLHERVGGEEHLRARGSASPSPYNNGTWGRVIGQHGDRDGDSNGVLGSGPKFDFDFLALQVGQDIYRAQGPSGGRTHAGAYGAIGTAHGDITHSMAS
jgi:hypothetical protein